MFDPVFSSCACKWQPTSLAKASPQRVSEESPPVASSSDLFTPTPVEVQPGASHAQSFSLRENLKGIPLTFLFTNDLHGQLTPFREADGAQLVGGMARMAHKVYEIRDGHASGSTLLLDAGDISTGSLVSDMFHTKPMIQVMNLMGYDGMTRGNHDFDKGLTHLHQLVDQANFPVLSANALEVDSPPVPYVIREVNGIKVGILGLTTPRSERELNQEDQRKIHFRSPAETATETIPEMKARGAEIIVALTHLGKDEDRQLAQSVKGIDFIIGGDSHTEIPGYEKVGDTFIMQTGARGKNLGKAELEVSRTDGVVHIDDVEAHLIPITASIPEDSEVAATIKTHTDQLQSVLEKVVGRVDTDLTHVDHHGTLKESNLADFVADSICLQTGADVCLIPASVLRGDLRKGEVTMEALYGVLPFDSGDMSRVDMTGQALQDAMESCIDDRGVRMTPSGLRLTYDPARPKGERIVSLVCADGKPLDRVKTYSVVQCNFVLDNPGKFDKFKQCSNRSAIVESGQDMLAKRFESSSPISQQLDGRIATVPPKLSDA